MTFMFFTIGTVLLVLALLTYPVGIVPLYVEDSTVDVRVPKEVVSQGYPETVKVSERYIRERWGYAWNQFLNDTFKDGKIYDYSAKKYVTPEEARTTVIGSRTNISLFKLFLMVMGVLFLSVWLSTPKQKSNSRIETGWGI